MTKLRRVLASLAVLTLFCWCRRAGVAAEKITFLIDWLPAGDKAVPYLEVQKGVFAEEGARRRHSIGPRLLRRGDQARHRRRRHGNRWPCRAPASARAKPSAVKAILSIYTLQPDAIFTTEEFGIATLKDVAGKNIATATFSSSNVVGRWC